MSQENVEAVRRMFAAYSRADVEAVVATAAANIEVHPGLVGGLEGTVYRGREGFRRFLTDVDAAWEEWRIEIEELRDLDDTVLALGQVRARARDGMALEAHAGWVCRMRGGKLADFRSFVSAREALEAVGLSEQVMSQENVEVVRRAFETRQPRADATWLVADTTAGG